MGDNRPMIILSALECGDFDGMTANLAHIPHEILENISRRVINEIDGINRLYMIYHLNHQQQLSGSRL